MKFWRCGNCGHEEPATESLKELLFTWFTLKNSSRTACPNCGSYTLQRAWDDSFKAGEFLIVKSQLKGGFRNGNKGKTAVNQRS
jgi:ribosomal protein S27AE